MARQRRALGYVIGEQGSRGLVVASYSGPSLNMPMIGTLLISVYKGFYMPDRTCLVIAGTMVMARLANDSWHTYGAELNQDFPNVASNPDVTLSHANARAVPLPLTGRSPEAGTITADPRASIITLYPSDVGVESRSVPYATSTTGDGSPYVPANAGTSATTSTAPATTQPITAGNTDVRCATSDSSSDVVADGVSCGEADDVVRHFETNSSCQGDGSNSCHAAGFQCTISVEATTSTWTLRCVLGATAVRFDLPAP